jgi:hypothetical protein
VSSPPDYSELEPDALARRILSGDRRTARWAGPVFIVLAVILAVWIVVLGVTLPSRGILAHQDVVWVGFDIGLLIGLVTTAWAALRRNRFLPVGAAATASLLLMDAWFDVVGAGNSMAAREALAMAVLIELPLSALCWWIALHAQSMAEHRIAWLIWRRREGD